MLLAGMLQVDGAVQEWSLLDRIIRFLDSPLPYSPFSEYLLFLALLWVIGRIARRKKKSFDRQAQEVLDQKYADGELSEKAYRKYQQDVSLRPKR